LIGLGAGLILTLGIAAIPQQAAAWEPKKPVEIVVISAKGGGADDMARLIQGAIAKHKLSSKPFTVVNKSGGTGAEALIYVNGKKGDNHTLLVAQNKFYTTPLNNPKLGVDISTFTPIGRMAVDTFVLWVHADTKIKTLADYVKAAKAAGPKWVMAGSGKQSEDEMLTEFLKSNYGLPEMKYVPYPGGGDVAASLAGKNSNWSTIRASNSAFRGPARRGRSSLSRRRVSRCSRTRRRSERLAEISSTGCSAASSEHRG
jgi:tripartite-type tricarboxylate transporter receptor subunit TctC